MPPKHVPQALVHRAFLEAPSQAFVTVLVTVLVTALAGGMGWGIRGQYGHETGAMMAGLLVALVLALRLAPHLPPLASARAVALATVAMGFGGTETYGQTIGLTQDAPLIGNAAALGWGMLGLAIKGGIWIGFFGLFLGMGLGGIRYRVREMLFLMLALIAVQRVGVGWINEPFDPAHRILPRIYFSDDWRWEPDSVLKPRREVWGGLLLALAVAGAWCGVCRRDVLAVRMMLWGFFGGALGFPLGQSLQAAHAWHPEWFQGGLWTRLAPHMNWWNWMETTFGCTMAAVVAVGLNRNRKLIAHTVDPEKGWAPSVEFAVLSLHLGLLVASEWGPFPRIQAIYDPGLHLGLIPLVAVVVGRRWPAWLITVVTVVPIAGKTFLIRGIENPVAIGWVGTVGTFWILGVLLLGLPLVWASLSAAWWIADQDREPDSGRSLRRTLLGSAWVYFALNFVFFDFPWPWQPWTARTPNALFFMLALFALTALALASPRARPGRVRVSSQ